MLPPFSTSVGAGGATQPQSRARRGGRRVVAPNPFAIDSDDEAESVGSCGSMIANPASSTAPNPPPPNREQPRTPSVTTSMVFASSDLPTPLAQFTPASRRVVSPLKRVATSPLQRELREQMGEKAKAGQGKWKGKEKEINPDENLELDDLLQGSKGYKKRKIAEEEERRKAPAQATQATQAKEVKATKGAKTSKGKEKEVQAPQSASPEPEPTQATQTKGKGKAKPKPTATPFSTQAALIREAEQKKEAAAAATAEEVSNSIDSLKNLSIIGSISVKPHNERSSARVSVSLDSNASSSRWNPAWEGKKNFKAFRSKHSQVAETEPPAAVVEEPADATPPSAQKPPAPVPAARVTRSTRSKGPKLFVSLVDSNPDEPQARSRNTSVAATRASSRNTPIPPTTKVTKSKQSTAEPEPVRRGGRVRAESSVDPEPAQLPTARRTVRGRVVRGSSTQAEATQPTQTQIQATQGTKRVPRSQAGPGSKRTRSRQVEEVDDDDDDGDDDDEDGGDDRFKFKLPGRRRR
ncbi:hypothetical protein FPQ18DRAFT_112727 [Pyronema domesticum]|nr:hypothetical protein FPQ18DRAFT_112727 [Pyronema domesticum]